MNWQGKKVLVTGGGSGIGREIVKQLHAKGADVVVATLVQAELDSLIQDLRSGPGTLLPLQMDLTEDDAIEALMGDLDQRGITLEVLVNNAVSGLFGNHIELDPRRMRTILTLNIQVVTELAAAVAKRMVQHGIPGHILNVASIAAFTPVPKLAAYSGSKHYVLAFTHALAEELAPHGIHVGALCPGITRTPIYEAMGLQTGSQTKGSVSQLGDAFSMAPEAVAKCAIRAIEKKQRVALPGFNKAVPLSGLLPDWLTTRLMYRMIEGRPAK
jgi:short-subunit dehydrogenase